MSSLATRLTLVFLAVLIGFGAVGVWMAERGTRACFAEYTQRLNAPIAMYMAQSSGLLDDEGIDRDALATLAEHVARINPSVEVYVLDTQGLVIAQASTANLIGQPRVSLEPVKQFLAQTDHLAQKPVLGDNPIDPDERRAFSAHPLEIDGRLVGYLYAVLAGGPHQTLLASLRSSYSIRVLVAMIGGALLLAAAAGSLLFFTLTRRLQVLTERVHRWDQHDGEHWPPPAPAAGRSDEIDQLAQAYDSMAARLCDQYARLSDRERTRRELFAGISHDLRTPLTAAQGYLETLLLKRGRIDADTAHEYLAIAHRQCHRLNRLVDELFELSRLDADGYELECEPFSMLELVHDAVQDVAMSAAEDDIKLDVIADFPVDDTVQIHADIALVQRVLENLLINALRFSTSGCRVVVRIERLDLTTLTVSVADDGAGIPEADLPHVFEPRFTKSDGDGQHAGLGLAIVERIVTLHGGSVRADSQLGIGSTIGFSLPIGQPR